MKTVRFSLGLLSGGFMVILAPHVHGMTNLAGSLVLEAERLEGFSKSTYGQYSNSYVGPTAFEWTSFRHVADALWSNDVVTAESLAAALNYEAFRFTDTNSSLVLYGVRALESNGVPTLGWGTYFVNTNFITNAVIEAPHPQNDFKSPLLAADVFLQSQAHGLLIAGAHRHVNGDGTADPCDLTNMIFHAVHAAWSGPTGQNTAWQIHGFSPANHPEFPSNCMAVLSTGQGGTNLMSTNLLMLNQELEARGIKAYAFNRYMADSDLLNIEVNEGVPGTTFTNLSARSNVQGIFSRDLGGTFVHIETATLLRTNAVWRGLTATAIASAVAPPTALESPLLMDISGASGAEAILSSTTHPAQLYWLEQSTNLTTTNWFPVATFTGDGLPRVFTNILGSAPSFFRVKLR